MRNEVTSLFFKYFVWEVFGGGKKLSTPGSNINEITKMNMMLIPATIPNSFRMALLVNANTAKPMAAVILQNRVTTPILLTMFTRDSFLFLLPR